MIKKLIIIGAVILLAIFQVIALRFISFYGIWPHLIIVAMVLTLLIDQEKIALYLAIFGGFFLDLVSPARFGLNIFLLTLLYFIIKYLIKIKLFEINLFVVFLSVFLAVTAIDLIFNLILKEPVTYNILLQGLFNAMFGGIIFIFIHQRSKRQTFKFEI